jgi:hypothetical protein
VGCLAGLDQRAGHAPIGAPGAAPEPRRRAPRRTTGPAPMVNWPGRELAPRRAPSAQAFGAQGAGTHLVHEHRRDLGDDGQDQPGLTACISGKSQPWNCRSSTLHTDGGASGTGLEGRAFFLLSGPERRSRPGIHGRCRRRRSPGSNACAASGAITVLYFAAVPAPYTGAHDFELCLWPGGARGTRTPDPLLAK